MLETEDVVVLLWPGWWRSPRPSHWCLGVSMTVPRNACWIMWKCGAENWTRVIYTQGMFLNSCNILTLLYFTWIFLNFKQKFMNLTLIFTTIVYLSRGLYLNICIYLFVPITKVWSVNKTSYSQWAPQLFYSCPFLLHLFIGFQNCCALLVEFYWLCNILHISSAIHTW